MQIIVTQDYNEMSLVAANQLKDFIEKKPDAVLGLPTGRTPEGMYRYLVDFHQNKGLDFSTITTFNLDEYLGLASNDPNSYHYFMNHIFFNHINIKKQNTHIPNGIAKDIIKECQVYEQKITDAGGIDIQILGIGKNGHIGFNEPSNSLSLETHAVSLTEDTIKANAELFPSKEDVPDKAITMGIGTIMKARKIIVLVSGIEKRNIINKVLSGNLTTDIPASILLLHKDVLIIGDKDAIPDR